MPDMGYLAVKKALLQVKDMCRNTKCIKCPLHKTEEDTHVPYCPLYEDEYGITVGHPVEWDIDDWREDEEC